MSLTPKVQVTVFCQGSPPPESISLPKTQRGKRLSTMNLASGRGMSTTIQILFLPAIVFSEYASIKTSVPPQPEPKVLWKEDSFKRNVTEKAIRARVLICTLILACHTIVVVSDILGSVYPETFLALATTVCPKRASLNAGLFTWSWQSSTSVALMMLGTYLRVTAYSHLGRNFTYQLAQPNKLTTDGIYRYIQHPSYTGVLLFLAGFLSLYVRSDGAFGCIIPQSWRYALDKLSLLRMLYQLGTTAWSLDRRVKEEERMLKETFGKEWVEWSKTTKRFIPVIY